MKKILLTLLATTILANALEYGEASFYSVKSNRGTTTASGERLNDTKLTAAHRTLPFGTIAKVTNLSNGRSVFVKITDDGPHIRGRIIDLSKAAAEKINMISRGVVKVEVSVISLGKNKRRL